LKLITIVSSHNVIKNVPFGKQTWQWKITIFLNRKYIFNPGPSSIAILVYQSVVFGENPFFKNGLSLDFQASKITQNVGRFSPQGSSLQVVCRQVSRRAPGTHHLSSHLPIDLLIRE